MSARRELLDLFARPVESVALIDGERRWSGRELSRFADQIAAAIGERCATAPLGPAGAPVIGVCLQRGAASVATLLGILRAGAVYLPLDDADPDERLRELLANAGPQLIIAGQAQAARLACCADLALLPIEEVACARGYAAPPGPPRPGPEPPAYLLFTSGSTGRAKGVLGSCRGIGNRLRWGERHLPLRPDDVACHRTPTAFVDSIAEILAPLAAGVPSVVADDAANRDPELLLSLLRAHGVTRLTLVPSMLRTLLGVPAAGGVLAGLRSCVVSGEVLPPEVAFEFRERFPACRLLNLYGSTEVAADATWHEVQLRDRGFPSIPLGRPLDGIDVAVLRDDRTPADAGEVGEIFVFSDDAVADGYLGDASAGAGTFLTNDFHPGSAHRRAYRTGDLGYCASGLLFYAGRRDRTLKLAGRKLNPCEIERIDERLTVAVRAAGAQERLVGIVAGDLSPHASPDDWMADFMARARRTLPAYMIPRIYAWLAQPPRRPSGKLDRRALAERDDLEWRSAHPVAHHPDDAIARRLHDLVARQLGVAELDMEVDLFDAGLASIEAAALAAGCNQLFTRQLTVADIYRASTLRALAAVLRFTGPPLAGVFPIAAGDGPPLFLVHPAGGLGFGYRHLAGRLAGHAIFGIDAPAFGRPDKPYATLEALAAMHIEAIVPHHAGEVQLGGWSFGGEVAFEMAAQLRRAGVRVRRVILIDTARSSEPTDDSKPEAREQYLVRNGIDPASRLGAHMRIDMLHHDQLSRRWTPSREGGEVVLLKASAGASAEPCNGWLPHCAAGLRVLPVAGEHDYLFDAWHIEEMVRALRTALRAPQATSGE